MKKRILVKYEFYPVLGLAIGIDVPGKSLLILLPFIGISFEYTRKPFKS